MKICNFSKISLLAILLSCGGYVFTSCQDTEFDAAPVDESNYEVSQDQMGYIANNDGKINSASLEVQAGRPADMTLCVKATKSSGAASDVKLVYDEEVLNSYNQDTENEYLAFPSANVTFEVGNKGGNTVTLPENSQKSGELNVRFTTTEDMEAGSTYVIPLRAETASGSLKFAETGSTFLIVVKIIENLGDNYKGDDAVKLFSVIETNDTNPLNHLCFTLKNTKKYLFDYVVLFSDNVIIDEDGSVHALVNQQIVNILNNREKYLKPLQDRGIKVILGIMAHHTHASVCNMLPETAEVFAKYIKNICETYELDGIFYDDEYNAPATPTPPGFYANKSVEAGARLVYEIKRAMPDKVNIVYAMGEFMDMSSAGCTIDGMTINDYIDYVMEDYQATMMIDFEHGFPGMPQSKYGWRSSQFAKGWWRTDDDLRGVEDRGNCHFIFAMDPFRDSFDTPYKNGRKDPSGSTQLEELKRMARIFYNDELVYDEKPYLPDHK